jgi:hypothetical protein
LKADPSGGSVLKDVVFLAIPLLTAVIAATIVLSGKAAGLSTGIGTAGVDVVSALLFSALSAVTLFYGLKRHPLRLARVLVAAVTLAGTVSGLVLFKLWLETWGAVPAIFLLALPMGYLGVRWSFQGYWGSLSGRRMNVVIISSATLMGSLIGTSLPPTFTISFLVGLAIMDFVFVETDFIPSTVGPGKYAEVASLTTLPLETSLVGMGDFLGYSMLVATSLELSGYYGALETISLILLGVLATLKIVRTKYRVPGLLIPVGLGLIPVILTLELSL